MKYLQMYKEISIMAEKEKVLNVIQDHLKSLVSYNPQWKMSNENDIEDICSHTNVTDVNSNDTSVNLISPIAVELTDNMGRQVVATRDIEAGELLLLESPLLSIMPQQGDTAVCVSCLLNLENDFPSCSGCGAPKCLDQCTTSDPHTPEECHIILQYGFCDKLTLEERLSMIRTFNALLTPLRALREIGTSSQKAELLWALEDNVEKRKKIPNGLEKEYKVATLMQKQLKLDIETNKLLRVWGIYESNSFEVPLSDQKHHRGCALFSTTSMMNHSCHFNAQVAFFDDLAHVWATRNIPNGSPITINYSQVFLCSQSRRLGLAKSKLFNCQCSRCIDPTELGSHLSSIKCVKCHTGLLISPGDPPDMSYSSDILPANHKEPWPCSSCEMSIPFSTIETLTHLTATFMAKVDKNNINCMKNTLSMMEQHLGPQNSISVELRHNLVARLMRDPLQELNSDVLWSVIDMTQSLLEVVNLIAPGKTFIKGHVLLDHVRASTELLFRKHCDKDDQTTDVPICENSTETCLNESIKECDSSRFSRVILSERDLEPHLYKDRTIDEIDVSELLQQIQESRIILKCERSKPKDTRVLEALIHKILQKEDEPQPICDDRKNAHKAELTNI